MFRSASRWNGGCTSCAITAADLGQIELAGIGNTGNRLIVDIEKGKPTVQLQKVLDLLDLLGLELVVRQKTGRPL